MEKRPSLSESSGTFTKRLLAFDEKTLKSFLEVRLDTDHWEDGSHFRSVSMIPLNLDGIAQEKHALMRQTRKLIVEMVSMPSRDHKKKVLRDGLIHYYPCWLGGYHARCYPEMHLSYEDDDKEDELAKEDPNYGPILFLRVLISLLSVRDFKVIIIDSEEDEKTEKEEKSVEKITADIDDVVTDAAEEDLPSRPELRQSRSSEAAGGAEMKPHSSDWFEFDREEAESEVSFKMEGDLLKMKLFVVQLIRDWRNQYTFEDWCHPATKAQMTAMMDRIDYSSVIRRRNMEPTSIHQKTNDTIERVYFARFGFLMQQAWYSGKLGTRNRGFTRIRSSVNNNGPKLGRSMSFDLSNGQSAMHQGLAGVTTVMWEEYKKVDESKKGTKKLKRQRTATVGVFEWIKRKTKSVTTSTPPTKRSTTTAVVDCKSKSKTPIARRSLGSVAALQTLEEGTMTPVVKGDLDEAAGFPSVSSVVSSMAASPKTVSDDGSSPRRPTLSHTSSEPTRRAASASGGGGGMSSTTSGLNSPQLLSPTVDGDEDDYAMDDYDGIDLQAMMGGTVMRLPDLGRPSTSSARSDRVLSTDDSSPLSESSKFSIRRIKYFWPHLMEQLNLTRRDGDTLVYMPPPTDLSGIPLVHSLNQDCVLDATEFHPKDVAYELLCLANDLFLRISARDFIKQCWLTNDEEKSVKGWEYSPYVNQITEHWNKLAKWVEWSVIRARKDRERVISLMKAYSEIARCSFDSGDYHSFSAIHASLIGHRISQIRKFMDLKNEDLSARLDGYTWKEFDLMRSWNSREIAELQRECTDGCLPQLSLFTRVFHNIEETDKCEWVMRQQSSDSMDDEGHPMIVSGDGVSGSGKGGSSSMLEIEEEDEEKSSQPSSLVIKRSKLEFMSAMWIYLDMLLTALRKRDSVDWSVKPDPSKHARLELQYHLICEWELLESLTKDKLDQRVDWGKQYWSKERSKKKKRKRTWKGVS